MQAPPAVNHPARVAERVATLDLISGGRVEFGTGEGGSQIELGGFGVEREVKRAQWEEALDAITRMFVEEPFAGYDGRWISMPPRNVVPKPKQRPHPPLWMACSRRETILTAAERGIGALSFSFVEPEDAKEWVDSYYETIASERVRARRVQRQSERRGGAADDVPSRRGDRDRARDRRRSLLRLLTRLLLRLRRAPPRALQHLGRVQPASRRGRASRARSSLPTTRRSVCGCCSRASAASEARSARRTQIADLVARYEAAGVDQVIFVSQAGANRHEHICESLELFAAEVMPRFVGRAEEREREKAERLARRGRAGARSPCPRTRGRPGYIVKPDGEPAPAAAIAVGDGGGRSPASALGARELVARAGEAGAGGAGSNRSRRAASPHVRPRARAAGSIFKGDGACLRGRAGEGFEGEIQYELRGRDGARQLDASDRGRPREAARGAATDPAVTMRASVPDFVRMAARRGVPAQAAARGRARDRGRLRASPAASARCSAQDPPT